MGIPDWSGSRLFYILLTPRQVFWASVAMLQKSSLSKVRIINTCKMYTFLTFPKRWDAPGCEAGLHCSRPRWPSKSSHSQWDCRPGPRRQLNQSFWTGTCTLAALRCWDWSDSAAPNAEWICSRCCIWIALDSSGLESMEMWTIKSAASTCSTHSSDEYSESHEWILWIQSRKFKVVLTLP